MAQSEPGYCSSFVGRDSDGDAFILVGVYTAEGHVIRFLGPAELEQLLLWIDKATTELFPDLWSTETKATMGDDGRIA
jgi:hypothetical protein